jgi:putative ABC transport system permease protein
MKQLRRFRMRAGNFVGRRSGEQRLREEIEEHLALETEANIRKGMAPEQARRAAVLRFGSVEAIRESYHAEKGLPMVETIMQDCRYTLRTLRRDAGFTVVAVLILALGIGANVAVFSVVNTLLLRPLPFPEAQQLIWIQGPPQACGMSCVTYSVDALEDYQRRAQTMQGITAYFPFFGAVGYKLTGYGEPVPLTGVATEGNFFQVLGVRPYLGRLFSPEETRQHGRPAALLSYYFWERQFHGDRSIVGQIVELNNTPTLVVGVLPRNFDFGSVFAPGIQVDAFLPAINDDMRSWGNVFVIVGRMKPGVTVAQARGEAERLFPDFYFNNSHPNWGKGYKAWVQPLKEHVSGNLRRSLELLWWAVGLILLIVCVNLSNLMLARTAARSKEFAMRSALGAGRSRIVRQMMTESLLLSGAGALLGLGVAVGITTYLARASSIALPLLADIRVDGMAVMWTVLIATAAAALFGTAPALRMAGKHIQESLKDSGHGTSAGRRHEAMRSALVISEVALACVLLVGAGLLLRSFLKVMDINLGFQPDRAAAIKVDYDDRGKDGKPDAALLASILQNILRQVKGIPGVEAAGMTDMLPLDQNRSWNLSAEGMDCSKQKCPDALVQIVTPGYLEAMGIRLREGRDFAWSDGPKAGCVVILNEAAVKRLWPGEDPLGRVANIGPCDKPPHVIGVVDNVRDTSVEGGSDGPEAYLPATQAQPVGAELVVRTTLPPTVLAGSVMRVLRGINPGQAATEFRPLRSFVDHSVSPRRFFVLLVGIFAGLGLLLAALGIYGVIAYSVTRQTQEIGIRMALGASRGRVQAAVLGRTLRLVGAGLAVGIFASLVAARAIASLLFGTEPTDWVTYLGMAVLLLGVAAVAGYLPARRASRVNPLVALRMN